MPDLEWRARQRAATARALVLVAALIMGGASLAFRAPRASAATIGTPAILSIRANHRVLAAGGGTVRVRARTRAERCRVVVRHRPLHVQSSARPRGCARGVVRARIVIGPNTTSRVVRVRIRIYAYAGARVARRAVTVRVRQGPFTAPTATLSVSPSTLPAAGGPVTISYSSPNATSCLLESRPAFWSGANPASVRCTGTYTATVPPVGIATTWTFTLLAMASGGQSVTATATLSEAASPVTQSSNWAGYVVMSPAVVTSVTGTWTVPRLDCTATPDAGDAAWVGTGGAGTAAGGLLQTGLFDVCLSGVQSEIAWWEELPAAADVFSGFAVSPGDVVRATVAGSPGGSWTTQLDDLTTKTSAWMANGSWWVAPDGAPPSSPEGSVPFSYAGGTSAEWIVEDFTLGTSLVALANFGTISFSDVASSAGGPASSDAVEIVQGGSTLAAPSPPSGAGFAVAYG